MFEKPPTAHALRRGSFRIATGFTTAFLGDERTLREFIVGEDIRQKSSEVNADVTLYLINDDLDPLTDRQLRIAVNKDVKAIARHREFIGRPLAEIPDPLGCHVSHAKHFESLLMQRLAHLDIHPIVISTYRSYQDGRYKAAIDLLFEKYHHIQVSLSKRFHPFTLRNLYRIKCPKCGRIDGTSIGSIAHGIVSYRCDPCGRDQKQHYRDLFGKLSWKLDCAARWNIYEIDLETFSKAHLADLGSVNVSAFLSREFFGGRVPVIRSYGDVTLSRDLSGRLLDILPPNILKTLFINHTKRDLIINVNSLIQFCRQQRVYGGFDYISYIKRELPKKLLCVRDLTGEEAVLVSHAQRFARMIYKRDSQLRPPSKETVQSIPLKIMKSAMEVIEWSIGIRTDTSKKYLLSGNHNDGLRSYLKRLDLDPSLYKHLRKLFSQENGPSISTLLATLPVEFLTRTLQIIRSAMESQDSKGNVPKGAPIS